jgi:hypothetical protein
MPMTMKPAWMVMLGAAVAAGPAARGAGMEIRLQAEAGRICSWEAVPLTMTLKNATPAAIPLDRHLFAGDTSAGLRLVRPDASERLVRKVILHLEHVESAGEEVDSLPAGGTRTIRMIASCDWSTMKPLFDAEGAYRLSVVIDIAGDRRESNVVQVSVVAPPSAEAEALRILRAMETPELIHAPELASISRWRRRLPEAERLAKVEGSRIYAGYAKLCLARHQLEAAMVSPEAGRRRAAIDAAEALLAGIATKGFTLAREVDDARAEAARLKRALATADSRPAP